MHQFEKCEKCHCNVNADTIRCCVRCMFDLCVDCRTVEAGNTYCEACATIRHQTETQTETKKGTATA